MYMLLVRPQRRRVREAQQLLSTLVDGDEVVTTGGLYGFINAIDGDTIWLDIAEGVEIRVHRSAISRKIDPVKEPAGGQPSDDEDEAVETDDEK
jgi:preprotein translocase subunit YajC